MGRRAGDLMLYLPNYAAAFRCIGQELQIKNIEVFELKSHADEFRLQCGDPNPPYVRIIDLSFSKENIEIIDREGRKRRGQSTGEIRFDSIPEILRTVGEYLDKKSGYLRRVTNSPASPEAAGTRISNQSRRNRAGNPLDEFRARDLCPDVSKAHRSEAPYQYTYA